MKTGPKGLALIKKWEGMRLTAYLCPANVWTIGYGHTSAAGAPKVTKGMKITQAQANEILIADLVKYETAVSRAVKRSLNQNQFDACVSLCFNIGPGAFAKSSVVRHYNAGNEAKAAASILFWNKGGGRVLPGLVNRRREEMALFMAPVMGKAQVAAIPEDVVIVPTSAPPPEEDVLRVKKKPVLQHRRVWTGILGWLGGGGAMAVGAFQGFDWLSLCVLLIFISVWAAIFWALYRREIHAGMFSSGK